MKSVIAWPTGRLLEAFPITLPDGTTWQGSLYQSMSRECGRRIIVREGDTVLCDTDECYDLANCEARLGEWLNVELAKHTIPYLEA